MDCRFVVFACAVVFMAFLIASAEGRTKKVVIHVPYKVKKLRHTHTIYKTVHHHHTHHDHLDHGPTTEEHEHFHHFHVHDDLPIGQHSQPVGIGIPDFLPDTPLELDGLSDLRNKEPRLPPRLVIPPYKRNYKVGPK